MERSKSTTPTLKSETVYQLKAAMPRILHAYKCANKLPNGDYCNGTRFFPNVNGVDKELSKLGRNAADVGARCNKCGRIYPVTDVQTALDHGFNFFSNPL